MTDKLNALDKLIEAVEAGVADHSDFAAMFPYPICDLAREAHHGSIDASLALHEALLPWWIIHDFSNNRRSMGCAMVIASEPGGKVGFCATSARAWLLAILRAYRSVQA